jgi:hypothetical protein
MGKADDALKRFEERNGPAAVPVEQANAAAEEMGVEADEIEIPPGIVRGLLIFELEDGSFGYQNLGGGQIDIMDALTLGNRLVEGARADLVCVKLNAYAQAARQEKQREAQPKPRIAVPRPMGRRPQ